jgi:hypothetical protein
VYFASPNGNLLSVQFDDVSKDRDQQIMATRIEVPVRDSVKARKATLNVQNITHRVA